MQITRYIPLLLCLWTGHALADSPIQLRHDATPTAHVSVTNMAGSISVVAWDRDEVQVTGRLGDGAKALVITGQESNLKIKVEPEGRSGWFNWGGNSMEASTLELHVPIGASLDLNVVSASVVVDGIEGGSIGVNSVSGKVRINARTPSLTVNSVSGSIEQAGHAEKAEIQTVSGDILAPALGDQVELQTVSGRIQVSGGPWQKLTASTVSGDLHASGALARGGHVDIDSMSGDVQLQLPADASAKLDASSFSGDLRSDFGTPKSDKNSPGNSLDVRIGDGSATIKIETFSGDVRVRRKD